MNGNQFDERLARLGDLSPEELDGLESEMVAAFDAADQSGDIDEMQSIAEALDRVRSEKANRGGDEAGTTPTEEPAVAAAGEVATDADPEQPQPTQDPAAPAPPAEPAPQVPTDPENPEQPAAPVTPETPGEDAAAQPPAPAPTGVEGQTAAQPTAAAPDQTQTQTPTDGGAQAPVAAAPADDPAHNEQEETVKVTSADVPEGNQPVAASAPNYAITAGGDIPGTTSGSELPDMDAVIEVMTKKVNAMRGVSGGNEKVIVASMRRDLEQEFGDARVLKRGDAEGNSAKVRDFIRERKALVASAAGGDVLEAMTAAGWCAPRTPLYDIPGIGSTDTPIADSLASFGVDRGGIIWTEPPALGDFATLLSNLGVWTNTAADGDPPVWEYIPGATGAGTPATDKPCLDIDCGTERSADLVAVPLCLCFDNLVSRANPELIRASTDLVMVGQARFKEQWLMAQMWGADGVVNTPATIGTPDTSLGITRDFLVTARLVASQFRWRNRLAANEQVLLYAPAWLRDAIASDLMIQIPGDGTMSVGYAEVDGYLADANIRPVWFIDDVPTGVGDAAVGATAAFDSYLGYGAVAEWLVTSPGVFVRLDGGSLDLGVVRTKEDVTKNKFCEFAETFESLAYMGPTTAAQAWAVRGTTPVTIRGGYAPAVATLTSVVAE